jgi:hypothetical protein
MVWQPKWWPQARQLAAAAAAGTKGVATAAACGKLSCAWCAELWQALLQTFCNVELMNLSDRCRW